MITGHRILERWLGQDSRLPCCFRILWKTGSTCYRAGNGLHGGSNILVWCPSLHSPAGFLAHCRKSRPLLQKFPHYAGKGLYVAAREDLSCFTRLHEIEPAPNSVTDYSRTSAEHRFADDHGTRVVFGRKDEKVGGRVHSRQP